MTTNILPIDTQTPKNGRSCNPWSMLSFTLLVELFFFDDCFIQHVSCCMLKVACAFCSSLNSNIAYTIIVSFVDFFRSISKYTQR